MTLAVTLLIVGAILEWAGTAILLDAWVNRWRRHDLTERLRPYQATSVADEAQEWLDSR